MHILSCVWPSYRKRLPDVLSTYLIVFVIIRGVIHADRGHANQSVICLCVSVHCVNLEFPSPGFLWMTERCISSGISESNLGLLDNWEAMVYNEGPCPNSWQYSVKVLWEPLKDSANQIKNLFSGECLLWSLWVKGYIKFLSRGFFDAFPFF